MATRSSWSDSSKIMEDFKHLSYYDLLREIERHLVKLQDSYRRIPSVPQSQPMDLILDLPAYPPTFQSIEPIEGVLESPHTESICDSMEVLHSPSEEHRDRVDPAPSTQELGSNLGANSDEQNCEMVYSSTNESIADLVGGNKSLYKLQFLEIDGQEISEVSLGIRNLECYPLFVDGTVGSAKSEFWKMNQPLLDALKVFETLSEKEMVDVDVFIGLLHTPRGVVRSIDFPSTFVFDPGKNSDFKVKRMSVEVRSVIAMDELENRKVFVLFLVFDPGITEWMLASM